MVEKATHCFELSGPLCIDNAKEWLKQGELAIMQAVDKLEINFTAVSKVDSSVLGLLFEWVRKAKSKGLEVSFVAVPAKTHELSKLYRVDGLLSEILRCKKIE